MDADKVRELVAEAYRLSMLASPGPWSHGLDMDPPDCGIEAGGDGGGCVAHVQCHGNINTVAREALLKRVAELEAELEPFTVDGYYVDIRDRERIAELLAKKEGA